jgi:hypothetical protein
MQILRSAYPTLDKSTVGPQACSALDDRSKNKHTMYGLQPVPFKLKPVPFELTATLRSLVFVMYPVTQFSKARALLQRVLRCAGEAPASS